MIAMAFNEQIIAMALNGGLAVALCVFFVMQGKRREDLMVRRMQELEKYQRVELHQLSVECMTCIRDSTQAITELRVYLKQCNGVDQ